MYDCYACSPCWVAKGSPSNVRQYAIEGDGSIQVASKHKEAESTVVEERDMTACKTLLS